MNKQKLGQFYTTNYDYILKNMSIPSDVSSIIEPFAGNGDLLKFIKNDIVPECYDIDPKQAYITKRDTLLNPPIYDEKFVLTNPPYLARNKNDCKDVYNKYNTNDLYKCFLITLINSKCAGGIMIIPLNFFCSIRKNDIKLRKDFLKKYTILILNIFEESVFSDTKYSVCSFQFQKNEEKTHLDINCFIYPSEKTLIINLNQDNNYTIGGEIYNLKQNKTYKIERLTRKNKNSKFICNILARCLDNNENDKISLSYVDKDNIFIDETEKLSARTYLSFTISPELTVEKQKKLVIDFNTFLIINREKYNSLFMSNYRESSNIARKRISFDLMFKILKHLL